MNLYNLLKTFLGTELLITFIIFVVGLLDIMVKFFQSYDSNQIKEDFKELLWAIVYNPIFLSPFIFFISVYAVYS